ncbi:MAG: hypothetical protein ACUVWQ_00010 [Candidatus Aminicenantales bacterium]
MAEAFASSKEFQFERIFVAIMALLCGVVLAYLAILGPLFLGVVRYRTAKVINNQLIGQDIVNLFLLSPALLLGGLGLLFKKFCEIYSYGYPFILDLLFPELHHRLKMEFFALHW